MKEKKTKMTRLIRIPGWLIFFFSLFLMVNITIGLLKFGNPPEMDIYSVNIVIVTFLFASLILIISYLTFQGVDIAEIKEYLKELKK